MFSLPSPLKVIKLKWWCLCFVTQLRVTMQEKKKGCYGLILTLRYQFIIHLSQHDGPEMSLYLFILPLPIVQNTQHYFKVKMQDRFVDISLLCLVSNNSQTLLK